MPPILHIHETCLYAEDLAAMERFYTVVLGLRKVSEMAGRGMTLRVNAASVLLIFDPRETAKPHPSVPAHGATGPGHCAFSIPTGSLAEWRVHLAKHGIAIERETKWPPIDGDEPSTRAISIYCRDPAGNSVELIAGELWPK